jgi:AraC family transcriptional regulator of adaptative response/methylated-DNA-[protein]-cysteine methyltransferase
MTTAARSDYARIEKVIQYLEAHQREQPSLADLARKVGLSEFHFHRLFSRWAGTTPKDFLKALTARRARELLRQNHDLLSVSLEAGLSGPGRLHDLLVSVEGMSPGEYKKGGQGLTLRYGVQDSPFGPCLIVLSDRGICALSFVEPGRMKAQVQAELARLRGSWPNARFCRDPHAASRAVAKAFAPQGGKSPVSVLALGSPFQLKVWEALLKIPEGQVLSYGALAERVGAPRAARAVGSAVAANPVAVLIPCHRVIRQTGVIGDYRWGNSRKKALLAWEQCRKTPSSP